MTNDELAAEAAFEELAALDALAAKVVELTAATAERDKRIAELEAELTALRAKYAAATPPAERWVGPVDLKTCDWIAVREAEDREKGSEGNGTE